MRVHRVAVQVLALAGCGPAGADLQERPEDTGWDRHTEQVPAAGVDPADRVFHLDAVHQIELTLPEASVDALWADPYTHVEAWLTFDGVALEHPVGARNKGRLGSYRDLDHKSGFKLDLNWSGNDQTVYGLAHLNINNMVQDQSQVHDLAAYAAYRAAGVAAPRLGYAWLRVNGEDFGLYALVEDYDDTFLAANFADPSGNLYDGDYWLAPDWSYYILLDFSPELYELLKLEEGEPNGLSDVKAVTDAVTASCGSGEFYTRMDAVVDMDWYLREWAVEMWVGQYDGYAYNRNNFRVYFDPSDGRARIMPWDHDWAFYDHTPIDSPYGLLAYCCMADAACWERALDTLDEVCEAIDAAEIDGQVQVAQELIRDHLADDPRKEYPVATFAAGQRHLRGWLERRSDDLRAHFGL